MSYTHDAAISLSLDERQECIPEGRYHSSAITSFNASSIAIESGSIVFPVDIGKPAATSPDGVDGHA